jgi:hypothetical protein
MANETLLTNVTTAVIDYMEQQAVESGRQMQVFRPVMSAAHPFHAIDFTGKGDIKLVVQRDVLAFAQIGEGVTSGASEIYAPTNRSLTPEMIGTTLVLSWEARTFPEIDPVNMIIDEAANAWAQAVDSAATISYASQYIDADNTSPDHEIGTDGVPIDAAIIRNGVQLLMTQKARPPFNYFIDAVQWGELMQDALAISLLKDGGAQPAGFRAVEGLRMDQFVGKLFGCNIWVVPGGLIDSGGTHSMMLAGNSLGIAFKKMATELSTTPSELNIDMKWEPIPRAYTVALSTCYQVGGVSGVSSENKFMVDIVS